MSVKRYPVSNGLLIVRGKEAYDTFNLQNVMVILATDYDALAASVDRLTSDKARLAAELAAEQESNTFLNNLHTLDADRLRALEAALRQARPYVTHAECADAADLEARVCTLNMIHAALQSETTEPVKAAGQWCHLCQNVHDLMSACPPKETASKP